MPYTEEKSLPGVSFFMDFRKAFDSIEISSKCALFWREKIRNLERALRVPDCNFRESLAKLEKSKLLIICLKFTFGELSSKILFECSGNF